MFENKFYVTDPMIIIDMKNATNTASRCEFRTEYLPEIWARWFINGCTVTFGKIEVENLARKNGVDKMNIRGWMGFLSFSSSR